MSEPDVNASLAARQRQVLDAVTGTAAIPDGFAAFNVDVARRALLDKRARELHYTWPILAASLGEHLRPLFAEFAEHRPTRGMRNDGYAFATWLEARGDTGVVAAVGPDGRVAALVSESGRRASPVVVMRPAGL